MPIQTFSYTDLVKDFRKIFKEIEPGKRYRVTFKAKNRTYKILILSLFDSSSDDTEDNFLKVSSIDFKDRPAFFLNMVRYTFSRLIITVHGKPKWVIDPTIQVVNYMLDQLNLKSRSDLGNVLLKGRLPILIGGNPEQIRRELKLSQQKNKRAITEKSRVESENARLKDNLGVFGRQVEEYRRNWREACNPEL